MTTLYKLTNQAGQTRGETQWGDGVTHTASGGGELCGPGWLHAYTDPLLAVLLNPIHADISKPRLWECEGEVGASDHGLKVGCQSLTTIREIPLPVVTVEQRVRFAILCAQLVCDDPDWNRWAERWLSGEDRAARAAWAAVRAARAAWAAARAARAAWAAARAAEEAWAAKEAAGAAEWASGTFDLAALAHEAVEG